MMGPRTDGTISTNGYKSIQNGELKTHEAILLWKWKSMEILPAFIQKKQIHEVSFNDVDRWTGSMHSGSHVCEISFPS